MGSLLWETDSKLPKFSRPFVESRPHIGRKGGIENEIAILREILCVFERMRGLDLVDQLNRSLLLFCPVGVPLLGCD